MGRSHAVGPPAAWTVRTGGAPATEALGRHFGAAARAGDVLLLSGPVGAGKTVFAGGVLAGLGVPGPHPSPTFTIVRAYRARLPATHVDLYRLDRRIDPEEIGLDDILGEEGVAVVEWAERLGPLAPPDALQVRLTPGPGERCREIAFVARGPAAARWLAAGRRAAGGDVR